MVTFFCCLSTDCFRVVSFVAEFNADWMAFRDGIRDKLEGVGLCGCAGECVYGFGVCVGVWVVCVRTNRIAYFVICMCLLHLVMRGW